jgi:hypothetical protein
VRRANIVGAREVCDKRNTTLSPFQLSDAHTAPWFSPALTVNYAGDPVIENRVVTEVASYGRQIGWLTEILLALAKNQPPSEETLRRLVPFAADLQQFPFVFALHSLALV